MATKKQKASNGGSGADPGAVVGASGAGTEKPPRKRVNPDEMFYWTPEQDLALTLLVMAHPGAYSPKRLIEVLAAHPLFASDIHLLNPGKVRAHVNKLSAAGEERGYPKLQLKRSANAGGYDLGDVVAQAAQQLGLDVAPGAATQAPVSSVPATTATTTQTQAPTPAPAPFVPPAGGFSPGGLIPTTG